MIKTRSSTLRTLLTFTPILTLLGCPFSLLADEMSLLNAARLSINAADAKRHVDVLADDSFEGRESGRRGGRAAAGYLIDAIRKLGTKPAGTNGYAQHFNRGYQNILTKIEGTDPLLKNEIIIVGAHYDHVGYGNASNSYGPFGYVHNGADDNASGTAAVLEMLEGFTKLPPPKRTILFAFWDGEEQGLLGSRHFANNPTVDLQNVKLLLNMDMVGRLRNKKVEVFGSRSAAGLREFVSRANATTSLELNFTWETKDNSDHWPFFNRNIPFVMPHSGLHNDYHRPRDDAHLINNEGIQEIARLAFNFAYHSANGTELPKFRPASRNESNHHRQAFEATPRPRPSRLGLTWVPKHSDPKDGLFVHRINYGSPASKSGIRYGDRIVGINGKSIKSEAEFRWNVLSSAREMKLTVHRVNDLTGETSDLQLLVTLEGEPLRMGIRWRENPGEPDSVTIVQIEPASPIFTAGLRPMDRVYEVNGQRFSNGGEFLRTIKTAAEPIELLVERRGRLKTISVTFAPSTDIDENHLSGIPAPPSLEPL